MKKTILSYVLAILFLAAIVFGFYLLVDVPLRVGRFFWKEEVQWPGVSVLYWLKGSAVIVGISIVLTLIHHIASGIKQDFLEEL
jgi:hypothetical protein